MKLWYKLLFICFVFLLILFAGDAIQANLRDISKPFFRSSYRMGSIVAEVWEVFFSSRARIDEIRHLRVKNAELEARVALGAETEKENRILRAALGREIHPVTYIYARIIGISYARMDGVLLIDAGMEEGIRPGMVVLANEGTIQIGTVAETASHTAAILLLSRAGSKTNVYAPESGISAVANGIGGGIFEIHVPASIPVREGEPLFSVGPPDFVIGYIEQIEKSDAGPFQVARIGHPIVLADVRRVFI
ncbi:MAG: hypothetical protein G01um101470_715, partial [Parcubacteria group bacterium Gr01-1014_70]